MVTSRPTGGLLLGKYILKHVCELQTASLMVIMGEYYLGGFEPEIRRLNLKHQCI